MSKAGQQILIKSNYIHGFLKNTFLKEEKTTFLEGI